MLSNKKIGIITIVKVNNYGPELQAFALQKKLTDWGFDAEIIDYLFYKHKDYIYTKRDQPFVNLGLKRRVKEYLNPIISKIRTLPYRQAQKQREAKFDSFHRKHTRFSSSTFHNIDELKHAKMDYDVYMVGSDQVWNPYSNVSLEPYFLTFAPDGKKKVSYASSFGVSSIPQDAQEKYCQCLNNLDCISVREEQGVKLVKELSGRDAQHVLDPTLLLNEKDWQYMADYSYYAHKHKYILLYDLYESPYIASLAKKMAADLDLDIIRIYKNTAKEDPDKTIKSAIDAGPSEFLGLFINASFVLTNSFHGTAFSVNFKKPFYTILPKHKTNNSRQQGFLSALKLENRLVKEDDSFPSKLLYFHDFEQAHSLLEIQKKKSIDFLLKAIND